MHVRRNYERVHRFVRRLFMPSYEPYGNGERFKLEDLTDWTVQYEDWRARVDGRPDKRLTRELRYRKLPPLTGRHGDLLGQNRNS